jgi:pimeloyl-ACP methyl ester carboxylesterase
VKIDEFIIMPNHKHGILRITDRRRGGSRTAPTGRKSLGRLIGAFKTVSTKQINQLRNTPGKPVWRHWLGEIAQRHTLMRYDERGCGLSDWTVEDFSFDAWVRDLETVVDELELERFPLLGISQGGAVAIDYTIRHPERVSHLILYGAYALGSAKRTLSPDDAEQQKALTTLARIGWGRDNPAFREVFARLFMPEATSEQTEWLTELQRKTTSAENAVKFHDVFANTDVVDLLPKLDVPTLVLHAREDARVPIEASRQLAAAIANARFVMLESRNHILLETEPAWQRFMDELFGFLGTKTTTRSAVPPFQESPSQPQARVLVGQVILHYKGPAGARRWRYGLGLQGARPEVGPGSCIEVFATVLRRR